MALDTDLNALLLFAAIAETGSFTAAADKLGIAKAKVSLEINRLEKSLGVTLFHRTTRRVTLSRDGETLYRECIPKLRDIEYHMSLLNSDKDELTGTMRIACTADHAVMILAKVITAFTCQHPQLDIELKTNDRVADMLDEGIDVSFRMGWLKDSTSRASKLGSFEQYVVATPAYLEKFGLPQHPEDLVTHHWITLTLLSSPLTWEFHKSEHERIQVRMNSHLKTDSATSLRALLESGAGISILDQFSAEPAIKSGKLVRVLDEWQVPSGGVYAVYPPGQHISRQVKSFVKFYLENIPAIQSSS